MVRNPNYWGPAPKIDILTFRTVPDIASRVATLLAGESDIVMDLQPATLKEVEKRPNLSVIKKPEMRTMYMIFNTRVENPLKDIKVRQAINYAIDKDALVKTVLSGWGEPLKGQPVTAEYWGFNPKISIRIRTILRRPSNCWPRRGMRMGWSFACHAHAAAT